MSAATLVIPAESRVAFGTLADRIGLSLLAASIVLNYSSLRVVDTYEVALDWQAALRFGLCGLCGCYAIWNLSHTLKAITRFPMAWMLLFSGWAWLTLPAAIAPSYATAALLALTSTTLFTSSLTQRVSGEAIVKTITAAIFLFAIACWVAHFAWPELRQSADDLSIKEPTTWRLAGLTHANGLGASCAIALGMLCVGRARWRWSARPLVLLAAFFFVTMLATGSRTALLMVLAGCAAIATRKVPALTAMAVAGLAALALIAEISGTDWERWLTAASREGDIQEIVTVTGRTDLWAIAVDHIARSPIWGWGYGCSRHIFLEHAVFPATHPHNMFLDAMVETGIPGALIEAAMCLALVRRAVTRPSPFADIVLLLVVVMGIAEVPIFNPLPEIFTLSWLLALGWKREDGKLSASSLNSESVTATEACQPKMPEYKERA